MLANHAASSDRACTTLVRNPTASAPGRLTRSATLRRRVWAWHFYTGLLATPMLIIASITGALLVFDEDVRDRVRWARRGTAGG